MSDNTNPIPNIDNPVQHIYDQVFNLNTPLTSLKATLDAGMGLNRESSLFYSNLQKVDRGGFFNAISNKKLQEYSPKDLVATLKRQGFLAQGMEESIYGLSSMSNSQFFYNKDKRALFFGTRTSGVFTKLPIQGAAPDVVTFGHTTRAVNTLGFINRENQTTGFSFADAYYTALSKSISGNLLDAGNYASYIQKTLLRTKLPDFSQKIRKTQGILELDKPLVMFDLETNGLEGEILQIAAIRLEKGKAPERINLYSPYVTDVNKEAVAKTKLTPEILAQKPGLAPFKAHATRIEEFFRGAIVGGYNVKGFDIDKLQKSMEAAGISVDIGQHGVVDIFDMFKKLGPGGVEKSLTGAFKYYTGQTFDNAHDAVTDIEQTLEVLKYMIGSHPDLPSSPGAIASLMHSGKLGITYSSPSLKDVLLSGNVQRGVRSKYLGKAPGLVRKTSIHPDSEIAIQLTRYKEAKRVLAQVVKSSGSRISSKGIGILAGQGDFVPGEQAINIARSVMNSVSEKMPQVFENLGIGGMWPLIKAENLMRERDISLPTELAGQVYGNLFPQTFYSKGLAQVYKRNATSARQSKAILRQGRNPLRSYITQGALTAGDEFIQQGYSMRVGVVDFASDLQLKALFQEGGAMITSAGSSTLASTLPTHTVKFRLPDEASGTALEKLFGINLASGDLTDLNRALVFGRKDIRASLKKKNVEALTEKQKLIKQLIGNNKEYLNTFRSAVTNRSRLNAVSLRDGVLEMQFISKNADTPGSLEMEVGRRRFTGTRYLATNKAAKLLEQSTKGMKVDMFIGADEFAKMMGPEVYLEQFFAVMSRENLLGKTVGTLLGNTASVRLPGKSTKVSIPVVADQVSAFEAAKNIVANMRVSGNQREETLAREIEHGATTLLRTGLDEFGVTGLRIFNIGGGIRTDFMMDINSMKSTRITPGKMRNLALQTKMLGFQDPNDDVVYRAFAKAWKGKGIGISSSTLDLLLEDKHAAKMYAKGLVGAYNPEEARVIRATADGLMLGTTKLKNLPEVASMSYHNGGPAPGVHASELEGTLFDPALSAKTQVAFLDIGEQQTSYKMVKGMSTTRSRYIPIPLKYTRLSKEAGDRILLTKNHPGYNWVKAVKLLEGNADVILSPKSAEYQSERSVSLRNQFFDLVEQANTTTLIKMSGKSGLFEKENTVLLPFSNRARLIPNRSGTQFNSVDDLDEILTVRVGENELQEIMFRRFHKDKALMKKGGWNRKYMNNMMQSIKEQGFAYAMLGADPMQRPEHASIVKLKVVKDMKSLQRYGQMNVETNQFLLRMLERDVDRDAIFLHFLENLMPNTAETKKELAQRFEMHKESIRWSRWIYKDEMKSSSSNQTPFGKAMGFVKESFGEFVGQKTLSSLGYSFARPVDYFMHGLEKGAQEIMTSVSAKVSPDVIAAITSPYKMDKQRAAAAESLVQTLYQGGVAKGAEKQGLIDITTDIAKMSQKYKRIYEETGVFDVAAITEEGKQLFYGFLKDQEKSKNRVFGVANYIAKVRQIQGIDLVEEDLKRGHSLASIRPDVREIMADESAKLLSERYAVGHAAAATFNIRTNNVFGVIHTARSSLKNVLTQLVGRVINPLSGEVGRVDDFSGEPIIQEAIDTANKLGKPTTLEGIVSKTKAFLDSPTAPKHFGLGLVAGAIGYGVYQNLVTPDVDQPGDYGPQSSLSQMNRAVVYGPGTRLSANAGNPARLQTYQNFNSARHESVNINVRNHTRPFDPRLAQAQMDRLSSADYVY